MLDFPKFCINGAKRQAIRDAFAEVISSRNYTVWACAILSNHAHMVIRRHRDDALSMWNAFADEARITLCTFCDVGNDHPVWSTRPYKVFLRSPDEVRGRIEYVAGNPNKEGLPDQRYEFIQPYNNWPFHKTAAVR